MSCLIEYHHARRHVCQDGLEIGFGISSSLRFFSTAARASNNCLVMVLNDCVRLPSSSELATKGRGEKLPSVTALVPSASSSKGRASCPEIRNALVIAAKIASSKVNVRVKIYMVFRLPRPNDRT